MKIGFIGLGIMGSRMAANLLKNGHDLTVYNRSKNDAQPLLEKGAKWAPSPAEAARDADVLITMVPTPEAVSDVALGENGFLPHMKKNAIWINSSTVNPSFNREMAGKAGQYGIRFVDAPVAGSKTPAEKGELVFLVGGNTTDVDECRPLFDAMGKKTIHAGDASMGAALKMLFNLLLGASMAAFAEALSLGRAMGFSVKDLLEILVGSPVVPPFMGMKKEKIESNDFSAEFPLKWMHKDLHLAALSAYEVGVTLPSTNAVKELFAQAAAHGLDNSDFSAIARLLLQMAAPPDGIE